MEAKAIYQEETLYYSQTQNPMLLVARKYFSSTHTGLTSPSSEMIKKKKTHTHTRNLYPTDL